MAGLGEQLARVDPELLELLGVVLVVEFLRQRVDRVLDALVLALFPQELHHVISVDLHGGGLPAGEARLNTVATVLVDAENVRRSVWPNIGREELERRCTDWGREHGHELVVVWEGADSADDRIASEVRRLPAPVWVVTSDRELRERVAGYAARIVGGGSFARQL